MALPKYATNLAVINSDGVVINVIWGYVGDLFYAERKHLTIIQIDDLNVQIGDTYDGEHFYHNDEQVKTTQELYEDIIANLIDIIYEEEEDANV